MKEMACIARTLFGVRLSPSQLAAFEIYEQVLVEWNSRFNLTAIHEPEKIRIKHFLDSISCMMVMADKPFERIIDIGTGAGFPGIPLKIINPHIKLTLVESVAKKVSFCKHIVHLLKMDNVDILTDRAETIGQLPAYRERYDWAIARAVAVMPVLVEYLLPFVRVGGSMLAMKGESAPAETHSAEVAIRLLGGHLRKLIPVTLPGLAEERYLVVIDKIAASPKEYPRRAGVPAKKPLT